MEKKVTGIDLDELKKEREAMMAEMGIMPTPEPDYSSHKSSENLNESTTLENADNSSIQDFSTAYEDMSDEELLDMINDFISESDEDDDEIINIVDDSIEDSKEENVELNKISGEVENNKEEKDKIDEEEIVSIINDSEESARSLSHYDVFAQFEINPAVPISRDEVGAKSQSREEFNKNNDSEFLVYDEDDDEIIATDEDSDNLIDTELQSNEGDEDGDFDGIDDELELSEDFENEQANYDDDIEVIGSDLTENEVSETQNNEETDSSESQIEEIAEMQDEVFEESEQDVLTDDQVQENTQAEAETFKAEEVLQDTKIAAASEDAVNENELVQAYISKRELEIETEKLEKLKESQKKIDFFSEIVPVNFVNVLSMQEFKNADNFTFVLGKSESGNIVFESLKNSYNVAFFANENSYELLHSMILSFMLKNSATELKMALCDGEQANNFNYYTDSKYLYGETIAKTEDEICQKLAKIAEELEERYRTLARFNVRSIDEYNLLAKSTRTPKLSQILIVIDGYSKLMASSSFEKIKNCLYQILRLGRIAGIYAVVVTNKKIEEDIINFNLPSRIGFKCSENDDSIAMIGELGIDRLANKHEFLYSSVTLEHAQHLRQPVLSDSIIKILIDNIEK